MTRLPVSAAQVQLYIGAVDTLDAWLNGLRVSQAEKALATAAAAVAYNAGFGASASGQLCYYDATAGLPADAVAMNGLMFTADGRLCVSTGAATYAHQGIPFVANGAVSVSISGGVITSPAILLEDGSYLLLESGDKILLE